MIEMVQVDGAPAAVAYCQGTPLRNEIEAHVVTIESRQWRHRVLRPNP